MKRILVLGGTGIIGTHLCRYALEKNFHVWCLSRKGILPITHENLNIIKSDIGNPMALNKAFGGLIFDAVVDLLSFTAKQLNNTVDLFQKRMLQYLVISSATVYKSAATGLITEDAEYITDGWGYALNKIQMEKALIKLAEHTPLTYTIIRPYITYSGKRLPAAEFELPDIYERIQTGRPLPIGDEILNAVTTVTHASDLARGIVGLLGNEKAANTSFNITSEDSHTWKEILDEIGKNLGKTPVYAPVKTDTLRTCFPHLKGKIGDRLLTRRFDTKKIKQAVPDFACEYDMVKGFRDVFPKTAPRPDILTQGILDYLSLKIDKNTYGPAIKAYVKSLRKNKGLKARLKYFICFHQPIYKIIKAMINLSLRIRNIKRSVVTPYR
jgi:nucleoside-diphosphate-sugar epimerase